MHLPRRWTFLPTLNLECTLAAPWIRWPARSLLNSVGKRWNLRSKNILTSKKRTNRLSLGIGLCRFGGAVVQEEVHWIQDCPRGWSKKTTKSSASVVAPWVYFEVYCNWIDIKTDISTFIMFHQFLIVFNMFYSTCPNGFGLNALGLKRTVSISMSWSEQSVLDVCCTGDLRLLLQVD